jgi:hypothetical protein
MPSAIPAKRSKLAWELTSFEFLKNLGNFSYKRVHTHLSKGTDRPRLAAEIFLSGTTLFSFEENSKRSNS